MNILHTVEFYYPSTGGMQEVVKQLSERLVKLGHKVTVATSMLPERKHLYKNGTLINGVAVKEFAISGNEVRGFQGNIKEYQDFLIRSKFDIVVNFAAQQWATDLALPVLDQIHTKKIFVPTGFSGLYDKHYKNYFLKMPRWMEKYDMNVFISNNYRDINFAREHGITKTILIPNGAGEDEFTDKSAVHLKKNLNISPRSTLILCIGSHTGAKGHHEAMKIFERAKIENAVLLIIGNVFGRGCYEKCLQTAAGMNEKKSLKTAGKRILIRELSRKETVAAYKESDLFLFPSNIECSPIVLFEAMAAGIPFLTTDVGNAKEIIEWTGGGIVLPTIPLRAVSQLGFKFPPFVHKFFNKNGTVTADIKPSAEILEDLVKNEKLKDRLGKNGHKAWQKHFTWEKITEKYEKLYLGLLKNNIKA